jgi:hypothetical protein
MATEEVARAKRKRRKPRSYPTIVGSLAVFAVVLVLLGARVAAGHDPVLGAAREVRAPRPEIVRRIVRKVIVETTVASHARGKGGTTVSSSPVTSVQSSGAEPAPALVTRSS